MHKPDYKAPPDLKNLEAHLTSLNEIAAEVNGDREAIPSDAVADQICVAVRQLGEAIAGPDNLEYVAPLQKRGSIAPPLPG